MKKILALTLAVMMLLCVFAGCSNGAQSNEPKDTTADASKDTTAATTADTQPKEELEPVTLKMYLPNAEGEGSADVLEVFNKKLAEVLPNTTLEITYVGGWDAYFEQWPLLLAGGEEMDIAWSGWGNSLSLDAEDGNVQPLNDLMEQYAPNLLEEKSTWKEDYGAMELDGVQYGIPSIQPIGGTNTRLFIDAEYAEYFDLDAIATELHSNLKTTEKLWDLLEAGLQAAIDAGALTVGDNSWRIATGELAYLGVRGYATFSAGVTNGGSLGCFCIDPEADNNEIFCNFELPEVVYGCERVKSWVDKGWITQSQIADQVQEGATAVIYYTSSHNGDWSECDARGIRSEIGSIDQREKVSIACETQAQSFQNPINFGYSTGMVIPYTSKNPERAMMLLNLLHDKPGTVGNELANLLCFGFAADSEEAKEYSWANYKLSELEDGTVYVDESYRDSAPSKHGITNWVLGNTYYLLSAGNISQETKDFALNFWQNVYPTLTETALSGMHPSRVNISTELSTLETINAEYEQRMLKGDVDLIPEYLNKLNSSCMETIKAELAQQLADYQASK